MAKLVEGEKYLTIQLFGGAVKISAFPNPQRKENKNAPHFKGDGVAVWVNEKKKPKEPVAEDILG